MAIAKVPCSGCKVVLAVPTDKPDVRVRCPKCKTEFVAADVAASTSPAVPPAVPPAAPPAPAPASAADDNDFYKKLAAADDPIATAQQPKKSAPAPGETSEPLPLPDEPPAKTARPSKNTKGGKATGIVGQPKSRRSRNKWDDEDDDRPRKPTNTPLIVMLGGAGVLALAGIVAGALAIAGVFDHKPDTNTAAAALPARPDVIPAPADTTPKPAPKVEPKTNTPAPVPASKSDARPNPAEQPAGDPFPQPKIEMPPPGGPPNVVAPGRAKLTFPAATPVELKEAPLTQETAQVKLPGKVTDAVVGGGGRYWCLLLPDAKQVAIFDVNQAKVTKYLPLASGKAYLAAGMNKLVIAYPDSELLVRYDLTTFEKEASIRPALPGTIKQIGLGSASTGPLVVCYTTLKDDQGHIQIAFLDPTTFREFDTNYDVVNSLGGLRFDAYHFRARPDGRVFIGWGGSAIGRGQGVLCVYTLSETGVKATRTREIHTPAMLAEDNTVFTLTGRYTPDLKPIGKLDRFGPVRIPAVRGTLYLAIGSDDPDTALFGPTANTKIKVAVHTIGDDRALVPIPELSTTEMQGGVPIPADGGQVPLDRRFLFCPDARLIALLDQTNNKLILRKFDLDSALEKSGVDYLFVSSQPPAAEPGKPFAYRLAVKSKQGGLKFKLDAGPDGMKIAPDGTLTWKVPNDWSGSENVIVSVSDKSGQETFHTFTLTPGAPGTADTAGGGVAAANPPQPQAGSRPNPKLPNPNPPPPAATQPAAVRPVAITPTKAADKTEIKLPAAADATCLGGNGRYVLFRLPKVKQVAILDVCEGKVVKYLPLPEDGAFIAAGQTHLFVLAPAANILQRWSLTTFEKELTLANPLEGTPRQLLMGHASDGPLFVVGPNKALDSKTLKEKPLGDGANGRGMGSMAGHPQYPPTVRISADGRVFAWWTQGLSPSGLSSMVIGESGTRSHYEHTTVGAIIPGPDGTLFTGGGLFTPELKPIGAKKGYQYWHHAPIPAAHGRFYLTVPQAEVPGRGRQAEAPKVELKLVGEDRTLADLGQLDGFDVPKDHNQTGARGLQLHDRVFFVPDARALVLLNGTAEKVIIHSLDIEVLLDKAGIDYLFVTSQPPAAVRGGAFRYKPEVKSRKGGVAFKLDAGPDGMKVAGDGTLTWDVPAGFEEGTVNVILTVSDKSGQETFHTFTLKVADR